MGTFYEHLAEDVDVADLLYEDALKACRREGHDWEPLILHDSREAALCRRCEAYMEEVS